MSVTVLNHPLVRHKLGLLRQGDLNTRGSRMLVDELTWFLMNEATKDLSLEPATVTGWTGEDVAVERVGGKFLTLVTILRAGNGMLDGALSMVPGAKVSTLGFCRDEKTLKPVQYYENLALDIKNRRAIILDPMLATAGTLCAAIARLKVAGCRHIQALCLVAAPEGLAKLEAEHPEVSVFTAAKDDRLNEDGYILPGLGDAGDRIYGTK